mgnify:CR=1 FL=1
MAFFLQHQQDDTQPDEPDTAHERDRPRGETEEDERDLQRLYGVGAAAIGVLSLGLFLTR